MTLILLNAFIPLIHTLFPSGKGIFFTLIVVIFIVFMSRNYKKGLRTIVYLAVYFGLYTLTLTYFENGMLASMFRMTTLFVPCLVLASILVSEYSSSEILSGLEKLKLPKMFVIGLTVTLRYIPTFRKEFRIIKEAMYIRGVRFSLRHPLRTFEYLIVPQLFRCLNLSAELTAAGLTKGISAPNPRSVFFEQRFSVLDGMAFLILFVGHGLIIGNVI